MTDERLDRTPGRPPAPMGSGAAAPVEPTPTPGPAAEREPPGAPPPAPPATGEAGGPGARPPEPPRRRREGRGIPILGIVLVLLGLALLARRFVPDLDLGAVWPYGAIVFGLLLLAASIRVGRPAG